MRRFFKQTLHLGSGERSSQGVFELHKRLRYGLSISSDIQQGGDVRNYVENLNDVVRDIAAALLGQEIQLGALIEYGKDENSSSFDPKYTEADAARMDVIDSILNRRLKKREIREIFTEEELEEELGFRKTQRELAKWKKEKEDREKNRKPLEEDHSHYQYYLHIKCGGRVWRDDKLNNTNEWLDLDHPSINDDAANIKMFGHRDLLIVPWRSLDITKYCECSSCYAFTHLHFARAGIKESK